MNENLIVIIVLLIVCLSLGFWIWMLVDCIKRKFEDKGLYIALLIFTGIIGAIIYYFNIKKGKNET